MILYKCLQLNLFWYEVPKTGCSSVKKFFHKHSDFTISSVKPKHIYGHRNYFQFAFVRNPWDRLVSCFLDKTKMSIGTKWQLRDYKKYKNYSFTDFVHAIKNDDINKCNSHHRLQYNLINHNYVDFIGRFENLQTDFNTICDKIKIPRKQLPHKNKTEHTHYSEYYNDETKNIVAEKYAKDIDYFNYKFGK